MESARIRVFMEQLARASADVILPLFNSSDLAVDWKADATPVTYADRKAEQVMRQMISREFPDHGIIGEEFAAVNEQARYTWVLDPIDGTRAFAAGCPLFGTLICLCDVGKPLWGALHLPVTGQLYIGNGDQCWRNGKIVSLPDDAKELKECFLVTTDPKGAELRKGDRGAGWDRLLASSGQFRSWGDCYGYALLLGGGVDIMIDPILNLWDIAALLPILRGAGLQVSSWSGGDPMDCPTYSLVAARPAVHESVLAMLRG
jgi:myo-inositol-1(or 4)-monophosphatase